MADPWARKCVAATVGATHLPVAVQVVALPWADRMCLHAMALVEEACKENAQRDDF